jgi:hypothetical protein
MKKYRLLAFAAATLMGGAAFGAEPSELNLGRMTAGYSYYNRPGADMALHDRDLRTCLVHAVAMRTTISSVLDGLIGGLIADAQEDAANRGVASAALENCMVVHGWRVVHVDDAEGSALSALPGEALATKLTPWVGAEAPHGTIVRIWHNDAALGAVSHFSLHAQHTRKGQLSLLAMATTPSAKVTAEEQAQGMVAVQSGALDPRWPKKALKPEMLDSVPADAAIIIVAIKGTGVSQGNGFEFMREGPDLATPAINVDHGPEKFYAMASSLSGGGFRAFAVPAGRWRINTMNNGLMQLNFCLGSPSFEVKAGEVVYAGQYDLKQEKLRPNLDVQPAIAWMAGAKTMAPLRPAVYINGSRSLCTRANSIYALEFEGAPFEEGYALGSKVPKLLTAP